MMDNWNGFFSLTELAIAIIQIAIFLLILTATKKISCTRRRLVELTYIGAVVFYITSMLHELGHALATKAFGYHFRIVLGFLGMGIQTYPPISTLPGATRMIIALAGPATAIPVHFVLIKAMRKAKKDLALVLLVPYIGSVLLGGIVGLLLPFSGDAVNFAEGVYTVTRLPLPLTLSIQVTSLIGLGAYVVHRLTKLLREK